MRKTILIAEDFDDDAIAIQNVLAQVGLEHSVHRVNDGFETISYLKGTGIYADRSLFPVPEILLLDLGMPRVGGLQVLEWMQSEPLCKNILIIVLTGHNQLREVQSAYALGAHSFLFKPCTIEDVRQLLDWFSSYWILTRRQPTTSARAEPPQI